MRTALFCLLLLASIGCSERKQQAADIRAGHQAALANLMAILDQTTPEQVPHRLASDTIAIIQGADARLPAAVGYASAEWPAPSQSAKQVQAAPGAYQSSQPPEPTNWSKILGVVGSVGLSALWAVGRFAPVAFPGLGSAVGAVSNIAWSVLAHGEQKETDSTAQRVLSAAQTAQPILEALHQVDPQALPPSIRSALSRDTEFAVHVMAALGDKS